MQKIRRVRIHFITKILLLVGLVLTGINLFAEVDANFVLNSLVDIEQVSDAFQPNFNPTFFNPKLQVASVFSLNIVSNNLGSDMELAGFDLKQQQTASISKDFSETHAVLHKKVKTARKRRASFKQDGYALSSKHSSFKKQFLITAALNLNWVQAKGIANYFAELGKTKCLEKVLSANGDEQFLSSVNNNQSIYKGNAVMYLPFFICHSPTKINT